MSVQFRTFNKQKNTNLKLEGPYHDNILTNKDKNNFHLSKLIIRTRKLGEYNGQNKNRKIG
jgi:hypothetical protein